MSRAADFLPLKAEDFLLPAKATASTTTNRMNPLTVSPNKSLIVASDTNSSSPFAGNSKHQSKEQLPAVITGTGATAMTTTTTSTSPTLPANPAISPVKVIAPTFLPTMQEEDDDEYGESNPVVAGSNLNSGLEDEEGNYNVKNIPKKVSQHVQPINIVLLKDIMNRKIQKLSLVPIQMGVPQPSLQQTNTPHNTIMIPNQTTYRATYLQPNLNSPNNMSGNSGNILPSITSTPSSP